MAPSRASSPASDEQAILRVMSERFERHRQPWKQEEIAALHNLAKKGQSLRSIAKALTRSEESVKDRAKVDGLKIAKLR